MGIRKKRAVIDHSDIIRYFVQHRSATAAQVANHFGISKRAAEIHLKKIRQATE